MLFRIYCEKKELYGNIGITHFWCQVSEAFNIARKGKKLSARTCQARVMRAIKTREAELAEARSGKNENKPSLVSSDEWTLALDA
jgi:hypothetical protein